MENNHEPIGYDEQSYTTETVSEEGFAVKSSEATDEEINESNRLVASDRADE